MTRCHKEGVNKHKRGLGLWCLADDDDMKIIRWFGGCGTLQRQMCGVESKRGKTGAQILVGSQPVDASGCSYSFWVQSCGVGGSGTLQVCTGYKATCLAKGHSKYIVCILLVCCECDGTREYSALKQRIEAFKLRNIIDLHLGRCSAPHKPTHYYLYRRRL
jgi:hypothetical protein